MNYMMYANDLWVFSPSVSGLRKLINCCADSMAICLLITYNTNKSYSMVIDNKPPDKRNTHLVALNNHTLPHTEKCKYLHIINNNLTDDNDIARQKRCIYTEANVLARKVHLCSNAIRTTLFNSSCGAMYTSCLWCSLNNRV